MSVFSVFNIPKLAVIGCVSLWVVMASPAWSQYAPHQLPPGDLELSNTPQFIILSFDDNNSYDRVQWLVDSLSKFNNPIGGANSDTFDGQKVPAVWFNISETNSSTQSKAVMTAAANLGHEIANHTATHNRSTNGFLQSKSTWENEIIPGIALITLDAPRGLGLNKDRLGGFRAPRLETNDNMYQVLSDFQFTYDSSLEDGFQDSVIGTNFFWPYKLDNAGGEGWEELIAMAQEGGNPNVVREPLNQYPEIWEIPISPYMVPDSLDAIMALRQSWHTLGSKKITGFDYNIFTLMTLNTTDMGEIMKYTLDKRLEGNRAPLMLGFHSDNYGAGSAQNQGIFNLIQYALTQPDVRFVTSMQLIEWMENPVGLNGSLSTINHLKAFPGLQLKLRSHEIAFNQDLPKGTLVEVMDALGTNHFSKIMSADSRLVSLENLSSGSYRVIITSASSGLRRVHVQSIY